MSIKLHFRPIPPADGIRDNRAHREESVVESLIHDAFGPDARRDHTPDGAPFIPGRQDVYISLSHSQEICVLEVSDAPVGVDVETQRPQLARVAARFMSTTEMEHISHPSDSHEYLHELLLHWTAKEAVYKLLHTPGLPLDSIILSPDHDRATAAGRTCIISYRHLSPTSTVAIATFGG